MTRTGGDNIAAMTTSTTQTQNRPWTALPVLLAGALMVVLDFFLVNAALPAISTALRARESSLEMRVAGGALVQTDVAGLGWRGCFLINVPIGLAALAATPRLVPESRAPRRARIDLPGAAVLALGLTAVLLPLIEGRQHGWPAWTWA